MDAKVAAMVAATGVVVEDEDEEDEDEEDEVCVLLAPALTICSCVIGREGGAGAPR